MMDNQRGEWFFFRMNGFAEDYGRYVLPTYARFDLDLVRGQGARVFDARGASYLDFGAGIAVCSLGHAHPEVTEAIARQAATLVHTSNLYRTEPQVTLARRLVGIAGPGKIFFCNSGAEANEGLIKLARKAGSPSGRHAIITFRNSFHGRTMAGISATGQDKVKHGFAPLLEGFTYAEFGDLDSARQLLRPETIAILLEPVQGEGGIHAASGEFLRALRSLCDERGLLLLFDEIQCGLGRTGTLCGWKALAPDVRPDGVSWAKGIANGLPLGAFWVTDHPLADGPPLCDVLGAGSHATTFGGNPVTCAAGSKVLEIIERDDLVRNVQEQGARLLAHLQRIAARLGATVRGLGLMLGLELPEGRSARKETIALQEAGLLVIPAGERVLRFLPPLNVSAGEIDEAAAIVEKTLCH